MIEPGVQRNRAAREDLLPRTPDLVVIVIDKTRGHRQEES
jgi:hypothetical protein